MLVIGVRREPIEFGRVFYNKGHPIQEKYLKQLGCSRFKSMKIKVSRMIFLNIKVVQYVPGNKKVNYGKFEK